MIDSLSLDPNNFKPYTSFNKDDKLSNFSKINIFIGANNSGKSRFCRSFFLGDEIGFTLKELNLQTINYLISEFKNEVELFSRLVFQGEDFIQIGPNFLQKFNQIEYFQHNFSFDTHIYSYIKYIKALSMGNRVPHSNMTDTQVKQKFNSIAEKYQTLFNELIDDKLSIKFKSIYIPILRGLRNIGDNEDSYKNRTIKDYFGTKSEMVKDKIYTGLDLYERTKKLLLGTKKDRDTVKDFETFLSETFFNNKEVNIIPRFDKDVLYVRIDNEELPIYDLGDGIQALIILTYPLFFNIGQDLCFFIEEPEHYLHPGFQRIFLETLLHERFSTFQYFITTHSNHFLDITLDINQVSVYTFNKTNTEQEHPTFTIENVDNENHNTLELIGVRNSSVFLSNCTIWVEGITDRIYLRKYLDVYQDNLKPKFKEDIHYSFVEYGGNNITHWSFLKDTDSNHPNINVQRLCGKLFLISDKDGADIKANDKTTAKLSKKYLRHQELQETLGDRYYCLQSREIENTLKPDILIEAVKLSEGINAPNLVFSTKINSEKNYKDVYIGSFLDKNIENLNKRYGDSSGTIKDKVNFAKNASEIISSKIDLSEEALLLTQKLYEFIKNNHIKSV